MTDREYVWKVIVLVWLVLLTFNEFGILNL